MSGSSARTHDFKVFAPLNACSYPDERAQDEISTRQRFGSGFQAGHHDEKQQMSTAEVTIGKILERTARSPSTVTIHLETQVVSKCCKGRMTSKLPSVPGTTSASETMHLEGAVTSSAYPVNAKEAPPLAMRWHERCVQNMTCKEGSLEKKSPSMTWAASRILHASMQACRRTGDTLTTVRRHM